MHCTALVPRATLYSAVVTTLLVLAAGGPAFAQAPAGGPQAQAAAGDAVFTIYLRGTQVGREQATLTRTESGWILTSSGRMTSPLDFVLSRFDMKYSADWQPLEMTLEARVRNQAVVVRTSFAMTTAINEVVQNNTTRSKEDQISARTVVLPNNVFAACEALANRLWDVDAGAELPVYVAPAGEIKVKVRSVTAETLQGPNGTLKTRRFELALQSAERPVTAILVADERRRLVRYEIPDAGIQAVREDVSSVAVRALGARNPTDVDVTIPANGFNLAGTLTTPATVAGRLRYPAVLLVGGQLAADRDHTVSGVAVFTQLAKQLADRGHVALRYDRRGAGQSGGRTDAATLSDYADDVAAIVKWLAKRDDVDNRHVAIVGYLDAGAVALLAAAASKEIDGVITVNAAAMNGSDLVVARLQKLLADTGVAEPERQARIDLQKKVIAAVVSGTGWEGVPPAVRRQADTPWFKSALTYDPATVMPKVKQPILILQADVDPEVPASEADRLGDLAKARKKAPAAEVIHLPDLTQLLTPAGSTTVSPKAADAIATWIKKQ